MGISSMKAQGTTEYLVLLAVVLIVALVSVALLGFFPGMASDAQMTQSKTYWTSASPIAIVEMDAKFAATNFTKPYLRIENTGTYPIKITGLLSGTTALRYFYNGSAYQNISDYYYLAPGEEKFFGHNGTFAGLPLNRDIGFRVPTGSQHDLTNMSSLCGGTGAGTVIVNNFGFEYIIYMEGQQLTKQQIGSKPLVIKCTG
jgi:hypothetical protein